MNTVVERILDARSAATGTAFGNATTRPFGVMSAEILSRSSSLQTSVDAADRIAAFSARLMDGTDIRVIQR
jgi:hypothetical protein